jgi:hypothetical protein
VEVTTSTRETAFIFKFFRAVADRSQRVGTVQAADLMENRQGWSGEGS